jgi:CysZ protein
MRNFFAGVGVLFGGFAWWGRRPGVMALGLIPAAIVAVLFSAGLIALGVSMPWIVTSVTPFAEGWVPVWREIFRWALGTALFGGVLVLGVVTFTAVTLIAGDPFYERIWRSVEQETGGVVPDVPYPFWRSVGDGVRLVGKGILAAIVAALLGLVPVVGGVLGAVGGLLFTGWLLADELTSRPFTARGMSRQQRRNVLGHHRGLALGFGVATQVCFLIPPGAIAVMPAAVAGSTRLAQRMLDGSSDPEGTPRMP